MAIEDLSAAKRALLARMMRGEAGVSFSAPMPVASPARSASALSYPQRGLWLSEQISPGQGAYHLASALRVRGALSLDSVQHVIQRLVERHGALRTVIRDAAGDEPLQVVLPPDRVDTRVPLLDLSSYPPAEREQALSRLLSEHAREPFDFAQGPLFRAKLYRLDALDHALLINVHHIVTDGWSMAVITRDIAQLYAASSAQLPALSAAGYADWSQAQRDASSAGAYGTQLSFWRGLLEGVPQSLELRPGATRPRASGMGTRGGRATFAIPASTRRAIERVAASAAATPYMVLLSTYQLLIAELSGQRDFVVGTSVANRKLPEQAALVGLFANVLALRSRLSGDPAFEELVARTRELALSAFEHQEVPFELVVEALQPARRVGRTPLIDVMFAMPTGLPEIVHDGMPVEELPVDNGASAFDLTLFVESRADGYAGTVEYNRDLFEEHEIHGLIERYLSLTERALAQPAQPISSLARERDGASATERRVGELAGRVLNKPALTREKSLFAAGGTLLHARSLMAALDADFGVLVPATSIIARPRVADIAREVEAQLSERDAAPALVHCPDASDTPLSFAQERMYFVSALDPSAAAYNIATALELTGALEPGLFREALRRSIARHEVLRQVFRERDGRSETLVLPSAEPEYELVDLRAELPAQRTREAHRLAVEAGRRPFDLARGPLVRLCLYSLAEQHWLAVLVVHHIAADGWSLNILAREMVLAYEALSSGREVALAAPPIQYADYARWQRKYFDEARLERALAPWERTLSGLRYGELPADFARPPVQSFLGSGINFELSPAQCSALAELCREQSVTPFMVMLAGLWLLLRHVTQEREVSVGSPVAGRGRAETRQVVGPFINTVVMRAQIAPASTARSLLRQVRAVVAGALDGEEAPFERVVDRLRQREGSGKPPFQVFFAMHEADTLKLAERHIQCSLVELDFQMAKFDLTLHVLAQPTGLRARFEYATALFERATVQRWTTHYQRVLGALLGDLDRDVDALVRELDPAPSLVIAPARAHAPETPGIAELLRWRAGRQPDRVALEVAGESVSYATLDAQVEALAAKLRAHRVGPDVRVAVALPRSRSLVVALHAVLRAGGAYVPIDPAYPEARARFMVEDSASALLLTSSALASRFADLQCELLVLDGPRGAPAAAPAVQRAASDDDLAYVIYTSGSTGVPKGVAISRASATAFVREMCERLPADQLARVAFTTSTCFDLSIFELFVPVLAGGTVIVLDDLLAVEPSLELSLIAGVPSAMWQLAAAGRIPASVRAVFLGGEPVSRKLVDALYARPRVADVYNGYGPSEDTTYSTVATIGKDCQDEPSIGGPLPGRRAYVLDALLQPVPQGAVGELYVAGHGLARGYLARPELTAERFLPDPFVDVPGARMYRTGDRVKLAHDGMLRYLGRLDHQVKVRGFRVELGEIEAVLKRQQAVANVVVTLQASEHGGELVAYLVPSAPVEESQLRASLRAALPMAYMPARFVIVRELPLLPNGKVDRSRVVDLQQPGLEVPELDRAPARTGTERELLAIWEQALRVAPIGIYDDFFALGGNSLLAMSIHTQVRDAFGVEAPLQHFVTMNVAELAEQLDLLLLESVGEAELETLLDQETEAPRQAAELASTRGMRHD